MTNNILPYCQLAKFCSTFPSGGLTMPLLPRFGIWRCVDSRLLDHVNREGGIYLTRSEGELGASFSITCQARAVNLMLPCQHCGSLQFRWLSLSSGWDRGIMINLFLRLHLCHDSHPMTTSFSLRSRTLLAIDQSLVLI